MPEELYTRPGGEGYWGWVPGHPPCPLTWVQQVSGALGSYGPSEKWSGWDLYYQLLSWLLRAAGQPTLMFSLPAGWAEVGCAALCTGDLPEGPWVRALQAGP